MSSGDQKGLISAAIVIAVVAIFLVIRLNERMDREQAREAQVAENSQCRMRCENGYAAEQRRCSSYSYDGTRDWCRDQARTVSARCLSRCSQ